MNIEHRYAQQQDYSLYNILARHLLVDVEREKDDQKEYKSFERNKPDELVQAAYKIMAYRY
ncbi:MAG: hypothetical protein L0H55_04110 [Candidatus Nitrosocosmicus sp.]|nr:hypothetical protein [Candidatus Nitrosocosmicus sp.]